MKVLDFKKKKPSVEEAQRRLENLFLEFVERGCDQEFLALLFFTFSVTEVFNHATTTSEGLLYLWRRKTTYFYPRFTPGI